MAAFSVFAAISSSPILSAKGMRFTLATMPGSFCGRSFENVWMSRSTGGKAMVKKSVRAAIAPTSSNTMATGREGLQVRIFNCMIQVTRGKSTTANRALT